MGLIVLKEGENLEDVLLQKRAEQMRHLSDDEKPIDIIFESRELKILGARSVEIRKLADISLD